MHKLCLSLISIFLYTLLLFKVLDQCTSKSTIAILPTGSGKTLIASYLIKNQILQKKLRKDNSSCQDNTIIVFVAPTKVTKRVYI